jgi:hypothetical protein
MEWTEFLEKLDVVPARARPPKKHVANRKPSTSYLIGITLYLAERIHRKQASGFAFVVGQSESRR